LFHKTFYLKTPCKKTTRLALVILTEFIKEHEKQKVKVSLSQKADSEKYFTTEASKVNCGFKKKALLFQQRQNPKPSLRAATTSSPRRKGWGGDKPIAFPVLHPPH
jgi:hypothetical protein